MELVAGADCRGCLLVEQGHDPVHQRQLPLLSLGFRQRGQGRFAELAQVAGQAMGGFGGVERGELVKRRRQLGEDLMGVFAEGVVVETGGWRLV